MIICAINISTEKLLNEYSLILKLEKGMPKLLRITTSQIKVITHTNFGY